MQTATIETTPADFGVLAKQVREALPTTAENKTSAQAAYKAVALA